MNNEITNINILWSFKTRDCYNWLNTVNNAIQINDADFYISNTFNIDLKSKFIPCKILVFLWHFLSKLERLWKSTTLLSHTNIINYIDRSWYIDFINTQKVIWWKLPSTVILPFSRVSSQEDFQEYLENFNESINHIDKFKYIIIEHISELQFNSIEHWQTQDIYIMWQIYPDKKEIDITIYDAWIWMIKWEIIKLLEWWLYNEFSTQEFYNEIVRKYWLNEFFIILCVCTQFSTKWLNKWGFWLLKLSQFLCENNWIIQIATDKIYLELKFNKICSKIDLESLSIEKKELDNVIEGTYISFTFSL